MQDRRAWVLTKPEDFLGLMQAKLQGIYKILGRVQRMQFAELHGTTVGRMSKKYGYVKQQIPFGMSLYSHKPGHDF